MKVALVHDDLVQWGGAEKVLLGISELFPEAPIYTSLFDRSNQTLLENFGGKKIITSFMQDIPFSKELYKPLFWLYPFAFELFDFTEFDLVITHTTRAAKSVITKPKTKHLCYCHTPPRYLWNYSGEIVPAIARPFLTPLRIYDRVSSKRVDLFLAGSKNAQDRIKKNYSSDSEILYPFIDLDSLNGIESFEGGYYLIIARLNNYKRVDLAVEVFKDRPDRLKVVGNGPELDKLMALASSNVEFVGKVGSDVLLNLLSGCRGLIITAEEDFGLTSLEAQALGKGVIAYGKGGALETIRNNETGIFFESQSVNDLREALNKFERMRIKTDVAKIHAKNFSKQNFQKSLLEVVDRVCI